VHRPGKRQQLRAVQISLEDVRRIYLRLGGLVSGEGDREIAQIARPEGKSEEQFKIEMESLKAEAFRITVTITGRDGESLFGDDDSVFASPNIPGAVSTIYMTNRVAYEGVAKHSPQNLFELFLDFSKPPLLDSKNYVSSPTPNNSNLMAEGASDAWVAAVYGAVDGVMMHRRTRRGLMHRGFAYDFGLIVFAIPVALYACAKLAGVVAAIFERGGVFLMSAAYVYIFFALIFGYRILFGYAKWAFPTMELENNRDQSIMHRLFWSAIMLGILGNVGWEFLKYLNT
jgi:hypothetical protein